MVSWRWLCKVFSVYKLKHLRSIMSFWMTDLWVVSLFQVQFTSSCGVSICWVPQEGRQWIWNYRSCMFSNGCSVAITNNNDNKICRCTSSNLRRLFISHFSLWYEIACEMIYQIGSNYSFSAGFKSCKEKTCNWSYLLLILF